jgi:hypothetical protein
MVSQIGVIGSPPDPNARSDQNVAGASTFRYSWEIEVDDNIDRLNVQFLW